MVGLHFIQCRSDVPHQRHDEEGDMEDRLGEEVETLNEGVVPSYTLEVDNP